MQDVYDSIYGNSKTQPLRYGQMGAGVGYGKKELPPVDDTEEDGFFGKLNKKMSEKVGGDGLFSGMSKGEMLGTNLGLSALGGIEDQYNKASDLQAAASVAASEALLRNKVDLPKKQNEMRGLASNMFAVNDQLQNMADAEIAKRNQEKLANFFDRSLRSLDAAKDPSKKQIVPEYEG